jgi:hypothetical protein
VELYDLTVDRGETKNLAASRPDLVERMTSILRTARVDVTPPKQDPRIWEKYREDNQRLDALFAQ